MKPLCLMCGCLLGLSSLTFADEQQHMVTLTVHVISAEGQPLDPKGDASAILKAEAELAAAGKLRYSDHLRMTALEGQLSSCQFGKAEFLITGRNTAGGFNRGGPPGLPIYSREDMGTILSATTRVVEQGVVAELTFEQSRLDPVKPSAENAESAPPPSKGITQVKTTVVLPTGSPVVIGGMTTQVDHGPLVSTVILATATIGQAVPVAAAQAPLKQVQIFALQKLQAAAAQEFLNKVFAEDDLKFAADERTNALVIHGTSDQLADLKDVLQQLDR